MSNGKQNKDTKHKKSKIKTCSNGDICKLLLAPYDSPTKISSLGYRALFTLITLIIMGYNIRKDNSFFVGVFMFGLPLLFDYLKFKPEEKARECIRNIGLYASGIEVIGSFLALVGIFQVVENSNGIRVCISEK